ncbi:unnamed protein product [Discosporangium mesarthrocarpum]
MDAETNKPPEKPVGVVGEGGASAEEKDQAHVDGDKHSHRFWMYMDDVNVAQHGPCPQSTMMKLIRDGIVSKDTMAWSEGMAEWQPLEKIETFREMAVLASTPWIYLDETSQQKGAPWRKWSRVIHH